MSQIFTICIDGLHNNGKSTQLHLLKSRLEDRGIATVIKRGDGMRSGTGKDETDPVSEWWQENISRMRATGFEGNESMRAAEEAANRLNREIYITKNYCLPRQMQRTGHNTGVILLDRGIVSRLFVARRENPIADLNEAGYFINNTGRHEVMLPNIIFLLHAPLDTLLARNSNRDDAKAKFNDTVLTKFYPDFELVIANLPTEIAKKVMIIDSRQSIEKIEEAIWLNTTRLIEGSIAANHERL